MGHKSLPPPVKHLSGDDRGGAPQPRHRHTGILSDVPADTLPVRPHEPLQLRFAAVDNSRRHLCPTAAPLPQASLLLAWVICTTAAAAHLTALPLLLSRTDHM